MREHRPDMRVALVAAVLVLVLLIGQWGTVRFAPETGVADTGRIIGKTGFAYLGGVRTFVAAMLWNRLDPQFHKYYAGMNVKQLTFMLPTMRLVVALDPQFTQAYQVSSFIVFYKGTPAEGVAIAKEGVANNPHSGIMHSNLAQLLFLQDPVANRTAVLEQAEAALASDATWANSDDEYEGLATVRGLLSALGEEDRVPEVKARLSELRAEDSATSEGE